MPRKMPRASEHMIARGRSLRQQAPVPERLLWWRLRGEQFPGFKFRRQHPLGPYVIDFYCAAAHLAVELDGRSQEGRGTTDVARQQYIERLGLRVLRFTNDHVLADLDGVVETIAKVCVLARANGRTPSPPPEGGTSPSEGEGEDRSGAWNRSG